MYRHGAGVAKHPGATATPVGDYAGLAVVTAVMLPWLGAQPLLSAAMLGIVVVVTGRRAISARAVFRPARLR